MLNFGRETFLKITPEKIFSTEDIRNIDRSKRKCLFSDEVHLKRLNKYSYINCMAECRSKILYERCGCVPMTTPNSGPYPICSELDQIICVIDSRGKYLGYNLVI